MSESVSRAEVTSILADYGRQHPRADIHAMRRLLTDVFGADFSTLQVLKATYRDDAHVLSAAGTPAAITIHPTLAVFVWGAPDYAHPDPRGLYRGQPIVRWEQARYATGTRGGEATSTTLCPNCYIEFPGLQCDLCGYEVDPPGEAPAGHGA
jgi:hypothetical protein